MILNPQYYETLFDKSNEIDTLPINFVNNAVRVSAKIIVDHYKRNQLIHFNFQNSKDSIFEIAMHLFVEFANDIYLNHYDLPNCIVGDKLKRISDNNYYEITRAINNSFTLTQVLKKTKVETPPAVIPAITFDKLSKGFVKVNSGVSVMTIKNYFNFFKNLNNEVSEFPKICFEKNIVFISKKPLWDYLILKNKIPSTYLPK